GDRRVHRDRDLVLARDLPEPRGEVVVHPEAPLEVDLAGRVAPLEQELDRLLRALPRGDPRRPELQLAHAADATRLRETLRGRARRGRGSVPVTRRWPRGKTRGGRPTMFLRLFHVYAAAAARAD